MPEDSELENMLEAVLESMHENDLPENYMPDNEMIWFIVLAIAVGVAVFILVARPFTPRRHGHTQASHSVLLGLFLGVLSATAILVLPRLFAYQHGNSATTTVLMGLRMMQAIGINDNFMEYIEPTPVGFVSTLYFCLLTCAYIALPILVALNVFELLTRNLDDCSEWIACHFSSRHKDVVLFNSPESLSFEMALQALDDRSKNCYVVFASMTKEMRNGWGSEIEALGRRRVRYLESGFADLARRFAMVSKFKTLTCIAVSEDTNRNVASTCKALEGLKGKRVAAGERPCRTLIGEGNRDRAANVRLFVLYGNAEDEYLLDAANESHGSGADLVPRFQLGKLRVEPMAALQILESVPLFTVLDQTKSPEGALRPVEPEQLQVLIFGSGTYAEEALKAVLWQGQMESVELDVHVVGAHAASLEDRLYASCPGLRGEGRFGLEFHPIPTTSPELAAFIDRTVTSDHLYVIVSIEDDERSYELAVTMRRLLLGHFAGRRIDVATTPVIACLTRNPDIYTRVSPDFDLSRNHFGIHAYGCTKDLLSFENVVNSPLERASSIPNRLYGLLSEGMSGIPLDHDPIDPLAVRDGIAAVVESGSISSEPEGRTGWSVSSLPQIQYWSNIASTSHAGYKSWALGVVTKDEVQGFIRDHGLRELDADVLRALGSNEHDRWTVFYETQGFEYMDEDEQVRLSQTLGGDNKRQKVEALKKHVMICPLEDIWGNYLHAMEGFGYADRAPAREGEGRVTVRSSKPDATVAMQLLDADYRVLRDFSLGAEDVELGGLADGTYVVHPTEALPLRECAQDTDFRLAGGRLVAPAASDGTLTVAVEGDPLVNPNAYDIAFAMLSPYLVNELGWWRSAPAERL